MCGVRVCDVRSSSYVQYVSKDMRTRVTMQAPLVDVGVAESMQRTE